MDNNQVRDFYKEEAEYEKSILIIKEIIVKIISMKQEVFNDKISHLDSESKYTEFFDLLNAVIGRKTNKYYLCDKEDDVKYYNLELDKVYRVENMNTDIQARCSEEKQLNLQARAVLAERLLIITKELKDIFSLNLGKSDGSLATFDSYIITEQDIDYLNNLIKYLEILIDKTGRLKILVTEGDVFALEKAKEDYNKKSSVEKWFYKTFKKENSVIESMTNKNKEKK